MSPTPDSTFTKPEQRIADLERQLAERQAELDKAQLKLKETTTERDEALDQQTATSGVLQVINSWPGDLAPVFDAILEAAMRLCGASCGYFLRRENEIYTFAAGRGLTTEFAQYMTHMDQPRAEEGAAQIDFIKKARPDIEIVDQQWPKLGQSDFTPFITAQMAKNPDAVFCDVYGGDFVTFAKEAGPAWLLQGDQKPTGRRRRGRDDG